MSSMKMSAFTAVATVIGLSKEVAESGPLLATLAVDPSIINTPPPQAATAEPLEIQAGDPVTQAVVDNIIGKHPTTKELVPYKCEVCNVTVFSEEILNIHQSGAKHARKVKGQELIKEITNSPNATFLTTSSKIGCNKNKSEFSCNICEVGLNSYQQLQQHLLGSKHKNRAENRDASTVQVSVADSCSGEKGQVSVNVGPNRLYCAACNIHLNSNLQLHQHVISKKHCTKVNGRTVSAPNIRVTPYLRPKGRGGYGGYGGGVNLNNWKNKNVMTQQHGQNEFPNNTNNVQRLSLSWQQSTTTAPTKDFVPEGELFTRR